jgi:hypothetical protein
MSSGGRTILKTTLKIGYRNMDWIQLAPHRKGPMTNFSKYGNGYEDAINGGNLLTR